jgi:hypothetical protein
MLPGGSSAQNVEARDRQIVRCVSVSSHLRAATSPCAASALSRPHRRATRSVSTRPNAPRPLSGVGPSEHPNEDEADCEGAEDDQHKPERTGHVGPRIGRSGRGVPSPLGTSGTWLTPRAHSIRSTAAGWSDERGWTARACARKLTVEEFQAGGYRVRAIRNGGITGEVSGPEPDTLLDDQRLDDSRRRSCVVAHDVGVAVPVTIGSADRGSRSVRSRSFLCRAPDAMETRLLGSRRECRHAEVRTGVLVS